MECEEKKYRCYADDARMKTGDHGVVRGGLPDEPMLMPARPMSHELNHMKTDIRLFKGTPQMVSLAASA